MFGNTEEHQLDKLRVGFTFNYNGKLWKIIEVGEYYWNTGELSKEYTIVNNENVAFLEVEKYKGEFELYFSEQIEINEVFLIDAINNKGVMYLGKEFELEETYEGSYKSLTKISSRERLTSYLFYHKSKMVTIEKWDEKT